MITLRTDVLPAPLGPIRPQMEPAGTTKERSRMACTPPKDSDTRSSRSVRSGSRATGHLAGCGLTLSLGDGTPTARHPPEVARQRRQPLGRHEQNEHDGRANEGAGETAQSARHLLDDLQDKRAGQRAPDRGQTA